MSAYVLDQSEINFLTIATNAALELNAKYPGSYPLNQETIEIIGKYKGDLHNIYRALYITNIKAVNGRYKEENKTLPKYQLLKAWDISRIDSCKLKKACGLFGCYMYQCSEDPIYGSEVFNAFTDIYKLLCMILVKKLYDWEGNPV